MDMAAPDPLRAIRSRIDAIDAEMHRLLIERSGVVGELIKIKGLSQPGAAFRPDREADMMRRMVMRHAGRLPLATVEHIWREIITTFTAMQAPFAIAAGPAADAMAMRDAIRFYFGFSIPVTCCQTSEVAIGQAARSAQTVAVVAAERDGRWWSGLAGPAAPKIFAKLPFLEMPGRPADLPSYVIGAAVAQVTAPDVQVLSIKAGDRLGDAVSSLGGAVAGQAGNEWLVELPVAATLEQLATEAGEALGPVERLGDFFQPIRVLAERTP
jgi:chorismate mutase/prephenate dehydratase